MRRGQITIFITIAVIVLLLGFGILFIYKFPTIKNDKSMADVESFVQQCVKDVTNDGINLLSLQGGHIYPANYLETPFQKVSYDLPAEQDMQEELNTFIEQGLPKCVNVSMFKDYGYDLTLSPATAQSQINDRVIIADIRFPIKIVKGNTIRTVENFQAKSSTRFGYIYNIIKHLRQQKEWLNLTIASQYDADITIIPYQNDLIISVKDPKSYVNSDNFRFVTAVDLN